MSLGWPHSGGAAPTPKPGGTMSDIGGRSRGDQGHEVPDQVRDGPNRPGPRAGASPGSIRLGAGETRLQPLRDPVDDPAEQR